MSLSLVLQIKWQENEDDVCKDDTVLSMSNNKEEVSYVFVCKREKHLGFHLS